MDSKQIVKNRTQRKGVFGIYIMVLVLVLGCQKYTQKEHSGRNMQVIIHTSKGDIQAELFSKEAPLTVANFLKYVEEKFYDKTIFHRVIDGFMIQGGGMTGQMDSKKTHAPIQNEATNRLSNKRGMLAMARTADIHSASSQFFINTVDNTFLNHQDTTPRGFGYCVFGNVVSGMEVVDAISKVATTKKQGMADVPVEAVEILSIECLKDTK